MAFKLETDQVSQITTITFSGVIDINQCMDIVTEAYNRQVTYKYICDITRAEKVELTADQVKQVADYLNLQREGRRGGKTAIVAGDNVSYGLARMLEMITALGDKNHGISMMVFRNLEEARQWLDQE